MSTSTNDLATMPYDEYLKTSHWATKRKEALDRASHRCTLCNAEDDLHVHHRTYERRGWERPDDLIVLCKDCHERFHDVIDGKAQRTVKTAQKPQCPDGMYLFQLTSLSDAGVFDQSGLARVKWSFLICQAEGESDNRIYEQTTYTAYTGVDMSRGTTMRRWTEALLGRKVRSHESVQSDWLEGSYMVVGIVDGRIVAPRAVLEVWA